MPLFWPRRKKRDAVSDEALLFPEVFAREVEEIRASRRLRGQPASQEVGPEGPSTNSGSLNLVGLAMSGGSSRSATFNLGILQGLAQFDLLKAVDYLSGVSGGSYIAGWLAAWIKREGSLAKVVEKLRPRSPQMGKEPEQQEIRFLRSNTSNISPRLGLLSFDTWAFATTYVRNLSLNLLILVAALCSLLLVPRLVITLVLSSHGGFAATLNIGLTIFLCLAGMIFLRSNLNLFPSFRRPSHHAPQAPWYSGTAAVNLLVVLPFSLSTITATSAIVGLGIDRSKLLHHWPVIILTMASFYTAVYFPAIYDRRRARWLLFGAAAAGIASGVMFFGLFSLYGTLEAAFSPLHEVGWVLAASVGPPLILMVFIAAGYLHLGLAGKNLPDESREWFSRLGAWSMITGLVWAAVCLVAIFGPVVMRHSTYWFKLALGSGWVVSTILGLLLGKRTSAEASGFRLRNEIAARLAPVIFMLGLLIVISLGIDAFLSGQNMRWTRQGQHVHGTVREFAAARVAKSLPVFAAPQPALVLPLANPKATLRVPVQIENEPASINSSQILAQHLTAVAQTADPVLLLPCLCLLILALVFSTCVDVNEFSMHLLYRNRLTRCYLGASRSRRPNPLTGLDQEDDVRLAHFLAKPLVRETAAPTGTDSSAPWSEAPFGGPMLLLNASVSLVEGETLAWPDQVTGSFVFSPLYCGYDPATLGGGDVTAKRGGYRETQEYAYRTGGVFLGNAMAISGTPVYPHGRFHSSRALASLLTIFNIRLGWWLGNPAGSEWRQDGPRQGLLYLLREIFGRTRTGSQFVYLCDGGQFDNLGIYELVRRRCRLIVACDATADPTSSFHDLGNAIRKCRIDFGCEIEIDTNSLRPNKETGNTTWHCAIGTIRYDKADPKTDGTLVYIRPSLTGDEPTDLLQFRSTHPDFPNQPTIAERFDEAQFESYRALGHHIALQVFEGVAAEAGSVVNVEAVIENVNKRWVRTSPTVKENFTHHAEMLDLIFERLRADPDLKPLDDQVYSDWWMISDRKGFYLCNSMIQLMENVYIDLNLDQEFKHPDNEGWKALFKQWSGSRTFRITWALSAPTYGRRFREFCERELGLSQQQIMAQYFPNDSDRQLLLPLPPTSSGGSPN